MLIAKVDAIVEAASYALDATKKIVTIDPTGTLAGTTEYIITYAVTDIYGSDSEGRGQFHDHIVSAVEEIRISPSAWRMGERTRKSLVSPLASPPGL